MRRAMSLSTERKIRADMIAQNLSPGGVLVLHPTRTKKRKPFEEALADILEQYKDIDPNELADILDHQSEGLRDEAAND